MQISHLDQLTPFITADGSEIRSHDDTVMTGR
jgi:hypothetical protein